VKKNKSLVNGRQIFKTSNELLPISSTSHISVVLIVLELLFLAGLVVIPYAPEAITFVWANTPLAISIAWTVNGN
jgi:hypothetical protein